VDQIYSSNDFIVSWLTDIKIFVLPPTTQAVIGCMHQQQSRKKALRAFAAKHLCSRETFNHSLKVAGSDLLRQLDILESRSCDVVICSGCASYVTMGEFFVCQQDCALMHMAM